MFNNLMELGMVDRWCNYISIVFVYVSLCPCALLQCNDVLSSQTVRWMFSGSSRNPDLPATASEWWDDKQSNEMENLGQYYETT